MLRTCVLNGWSVDSYLDPSHPLQQGLHRFLEATIDSHTAHTAIDGCGAPAWAMPLTKLAGAYRGAVTAEDRASPMARVADAMRAYPDYVCGDASEVTGLMRAVPGLLVKDGAESVYVAALPDGRACAVKISDGGFRAGQAVLVESLRTLDVVDVPGVDLAQLDRWGDVPVTGHGVPVGEIRSIALL
jgi:L-asparaginase II